MRRWGEKKWGNGWEKFIERHYCFTERYSIRVRMEGKNTNKTRDVSC